MASRIWTFFFYHVDLDPTTWNKSLIKSMKQFDMEKNYSR